MSEHTRGPWEASKYGASFAIFEKDSRGADSRIAYLYGEFAKRSEAETEANTHLMAAAPEMLEALRDVVNYFWNPDSPALSEGDVHDLVRAAIAKAEHK